MRRTAEDDERVEITSVDDLHDWLVEHHARSDGAWLVTWKKGRGPYVPYPEVVRELLCFGWIDSQGRKVDDDRWSVRIAPWPVATDCAAPALPAASTCSRTAA